MNVRLSPKPSHLAFGILPGAETALLNRLVQRIFAIQNLQGLFIAERLQRLRICFPPAGQQRPNFFEQAVLKHRPTSLVEVLVQRSSTRIKTDLEWLGAWHGIAGQLLRFGRGAAGETDDFNGANQFLMIVGVNSSRGCRIVLVQKTMESGGTAFGERGQAGAQAFIAKRGGGKAGEQGTQIETSAADDDGGAPALADFRDSRPGETRIRAGSELAVGTRDIEQVMRNAAPFSDRQFGRPDLKSAIDLDGIAIDDFTLEGLGEHQGEVAFSGASGS